MRRISKVLKCGISKVWVTVQKPSSVFFVPSCETIKENGRSEVTSANRYWGSDTSNTNTPVLGQQYSYEYDSIGNRISTSTPNSSLLTSNSVYTANELNQYVSRTIPPTVSIIGSAPDTVDVYVTQRYLFRSDSFIAGWTRNPLFHHGGMDGHGLRKL